MTPLDTAQEIVHIDLFSGIGGFALAIDEVWLKTKHVFCEIDSFCQSVLRKHWPEARIYNDIRKLSKSRFIADSAMLRCNRREFKGKTIQQQEQTFREINAGNKQTEKYIVTGGFPCQPFSQAGKRRGTKDDRYLWPEMLRVIREFNPEWVVAENVRGLLTIEQGLVFEQVCSDLETNGYEVQAFIIPACSQNAPHRRDRIWFIANKSSEGLEGEVHKKRSNSRHDKSIKNTIGKRIRGGLEGIGQILESETTEVENARSDWEKNWIEVATKLCGMDDGLSARMDGLKLSKSKHRKERLKSLGNAIVPQVAVQIMRAINESIRNG